MSSCTFGTDFTLATFGGQLPSGRLRSPGDRVGRHADVDVGDGRTGERVEHRQRGAHLHAGAGRVPHPDLGAVDELQGHAGVGHRDRAGAQRDQAGRSPRPRGRRPRARWWPPDRARTSSRRAAASPGVPRRRDSSTRPVPSTTTFPAGLSIHATGVAFGDRDLHGVGPGTADRGLAHERQRLDAGHRAARVEPHHRVTGMDPAGLLDLGRGHPPQAGHLHVVDVEQRRHGRSPTPAPRGAPRPRRRRAAGVDGDRRRGGRRPSGRGPAGRPASPDAPGRRARACWRAALRTARLLPGRVRVLTRGLPAPSPRSRPCAARAPAAPRWPRAPGAGPRARAGGRRRRWRRPRPGRSWRASSDTTAPPDPEALEPGGVDHPARGVAGRVAEHRPGVGAAGLVLAPPPHDLGQRRLALVDGGRRPPRTSPRSPARWRPRWTGGTRRRAPRRAGPLGASSPARSSTSARRARRPSRGRGRRRSSGPRRRRCRGSPRRTRGRRGRRRRPGGRGPAAGPRPRRGPWPGRGVEVDRLELALEQHGEAGEPAVGHQEVGAPPHHQHRWAQLRHHRGEGARAPRPTRPGRGRPPGRPRGRWSGPPPARPARPPPRPRPAGRRGGPVPAARRSASRAHGGGWVTGAAPATRRARSSGRRRRG